MAKFKSIALEDNRKEFFIENEDQISSYFHNLTESQLANDFFSRDEIIERRSSIDLANKEKHAYAECDMMLFKFKNSLFTGPNPVVFFNVYSRDSCSVSAGMHSTSTAAFIPISRHHLIFVILDSGFWGSKEIYTKPWGKKACLQTRDMMYAINSKIYFNPEDRLHIFNKQGKFRALGKLDFGLNDD